MIKAWRLWHTLRFPLILATVPYALVWAALPGVNAPLVLISFFSVVVFVLAGIDLKLADDGLPPRLAVAPDRDWFRPGPLRTARGVAAVMAAVCAFLALIAAQVYLFLAILVPMALTGVMTFAFFLVGKPYRPRFDWAEFLWGVALVVFPALAISLQSSVGLQAPGVWVVVLAFASVASGLLMIELRDAAIDQTDGIVTTAVRIGRPAASALIVAFVILATVVAVLGSVEGWWHPVVAAISAIAAITAVYTLGERADSLSVSGWWLAQVIVALLIAGTFNPPAIPASDEEADAAAEVVQEDDQPAVGENAEPSS
ncbi:MAG: hypothetical protein AAGB34_00705 [Planctomycetota bacterium]